MRRRRNVGQKATRRGLISGQRKRSRSFHATCPSEMKYLSAPLLDEPALPLMSHLLHEATQASRVHSESLCGELPKDLSSWNWQAVPCVVTYAQVNE